MRNLLCVGALVLIAPLAHSESVTGRWDATVTIKEAEIPFRIDFSGDGTQFTGTVFNGDLPVSSTSGRLENGKLEVSFGHYLSKLDATVKDGQIEGKLSGRFERDRYISSYPFRARRYAPVTATTASGRSRTTAPRVRNPGTSSYGRKGRKLPRQSCASTAIPAPSLGDTRMESLW
jgi:hypothetical protein